MINKVLLIGNLGQDPEFKIFDNGKSVARFSLATNRRYQDQQGDWHTKTSWHNVVAWGNLGKRMSETLRKGSLVYVEGEILYREYKKDDETRYVTDIVANKMRRLEKVSIKSAMMPTSNDEPPGQIKNPVKEEEWPTTSNQVITPNQDLADDLPF